EIDFVCRQANQVSALIQVSYDISASKTLKREVSALIEASDELNCQDLIILTWYSEQIIEESNKKIYDSIATSRMRATSQDDYAF
ncbi:MAG: hypothetical protein LBI80_04860, partial [Endomicrobium sp.]|nr:hypothetical protein [Endomicrobium sp.]